MANYIDQYREAKAKHPDMVLMFKVGDFYEAFEDDARQLSKTLGLTITTRDKTFAMCGFPYHQLEVYLRKMLASGLRVAILEEAK